MNALLKYAVHLTKNPENANDLLQETYLKAYRFWDHFRTGTNVNAWLRQIMKNAYINRYRKERKRPEEIRYEEYHLPHNATQDTTPPIRQSHEHSYDTMFGDEILHSMKSIHATYRNVVVLGDIEGLSYKEIAAALDCPIGTVRSRLHRGRKLLQDQLFAYALENGHISKQEKM